MSLFGGWIFAGEVVVVCCTDMDGLVEYVCISRIGGRVVDNGVL